MPDDFVEYLKINSAKKIGKKQLFVSDGNSIASQDISNAEGRIASTLPIGYVKFLETLGSGRWANAFILPPSELYDLDQDCGEMCGFIVLAGSVDGCGNYVCLNPKDVQIYFCCHDPFGYAKVANSFEEFVRLIADCWLADPNDGPYLFYRSLAPFTRVVSPSEPRGTTISDFFQGIWKRFR